MNAENGPDKLKKNDRVIGSGRPSYTPLAYYTGERDEQEIQMLALGISRWHPDPMAAIEEAKRKAA